MHRNMFSPTPRILRCLQCLHPPLFTLPVQTEEGRVAAQERAAHMSTTKETTSTPTRARTDAINELRYELHAFVCRPHWSEADKQKAFGFTTTCAHVYYGTLPLEKMDCFSNAHMPV